MRTRIALVLVLALGACKSKSDNAGTDRGGGSATANNARPSQDPVRPSTTEPDQATPIAVADQGSLQRAGSGAAPVQAAPPVASDMPASATKVAPASDDALEVKPPPADLPPGRVAITRSAAIPTTPALDPVTSKLLAQYRPALERCYRRFLVAHPKGAGTATVTFETTIDGVVTKHASTSTLGDDVASCMLAAVRGWRFPAVGQVKDPVPVRFEYAFGLIPD